jgi:dTDP-glucose 4,6-dehydratase
VRPYPTEDLDHILAHTQGDWDWLRGGRLLLTGGTGFLGSWMLESYLHARERLGLDGTLEVLARSPEAFFQRFPHLAGHPGFQLVPGDLASFAAPGPQLAGVLHLAVAYGDPVAMVTDNLLGMRRLLEVAARRGADRFLFTSSGAVYGPQPPDLPALDEDAPLAPSPLDPRQAYGEMKRAAELIGAAHAQAHGYRFLIARCFAFLGPGLPPEGGSAMGAILGGALRGPEVRLRGDGLPVRSYLHTADLAVWLWRILARGASAHPYNVGSPQGLTLAQVAAVARDRLRPGAAVVLEGQPDPDNPRDRYLPSTARAERELGLRVQIPLGEALERTARWLRVDLA